MLRQNNNTFDPAAEFGFNHQPTFIRDPLLKLREQGVEVPRFGSLWLATTLVPGSFV